METLTISSSQKLFLPRSISRKMAANIVMPPINTVEAAKRLLAAGAGASGFS
jgi:hypothetical protein